MRKIFFFLFVSITFSSCFKIYEAVSSVMIIERSAWVDTRTLTFYYKGKEKVTSIDVYLMDDKREISYEKDWSGIRPIVIELDSLGPVLTKQSVSIQINRKNTHWRDDHSVFVYKTDWTEKKRVNSTHTHH
jgi:hypothetical protein